MSRSTNGGSASAGASNTAMNTTAAADTVVATEPANPVLDNKFVDELVRDKKAMVGLEVVVSEHNLVRAN